MNLFAAVALMVAAGCGSSGSGGAKDGGGTGGSGQDAAGVPMCGTCFVHGRWQVDNLSPCFVSLSPGDGGNPILSGVVSTSVSGGASMCPTNTMMLPTVPWSTDTLTTDCPGHYRLCVTLKAGKAATPLDNDCTIAQSCAEDDYKMASVAQKWKDLPPWMTASADLPCAQQFRDGGGYAQLTATGTATNCGPITKTMALIAFCPLSCNTDPNSAACMNCKPGGTGDF